jgi:hypothetical protein
MTANGIMMKRGHKYDVCIVSGGIHVRLDNILVEVIEERSQPETMLVQAQQDTGRLAMFPMGAVAWCREYESDDLPCEHPYARTFGR